MTGKHRVRDAYLDEYIPVHELTRIPIVDGWTKPADPDPRFASIYWFSDKKTTLILKREKQVIQEILAAIKQLQKK